MAQTTKKNYKQEYLEDFIGLTGITDLTLQDVYGAMVLLVRHSALEQKAKSLWSKYQFMHLYRKMLDADDFYNQIIPQFKEAVMQTRYDRTHRSKQQQETKEEDYEELNYSSPEEDMEKVSDELLKKDDVYYESKHHHYTETLFEDFL